MLDLEATRARLAYDDSLLRDMVQYFFEDGRQLLVDLRAAIAGRRWEEVERAAHSMKGLAANFSARTAVEAARTLEAAARTRELAAVPKAQAALERETELLMAALRDWSAGGKTTASSAEAAADC